MNVQDAVMTSLFDGALELACSSRPQDGATAAYIFRLLLHVPSFSNVLRSHLMSVHDDDDDDDEVDDSYYSCVYLLLQLLQRQLELATVNLLQAS